MDTESPSVSRIATWCLILGGILAALGTLSLMTPWVAAKVVAVFCGISLLVAGVSQVAMAVGTYTWKGFWITLVCGVLSVMAGIGMLILPEAGVEALVLFLGFLLAFEAVVKLAAAFTVREEFPWGWLLRQSAPRRGTTSACMQRESGSTCIQAYPKPQEWA